MQHTAMSATACLHEMNLILHGRLQLPGSLYSDDHIKNKFTQAESHIA